MNKQKTLIGVGCSHTQGSAFIVGPETPDENGMYELASSQLKEKYKTDKVDEKFITNLSWVGKLNKYLKYDRVLNFGLGGRGLEPNIRSLRSYAYKVKDLSNHLIVIMPAPATRKEVLHLNPKKEYTGDFFNDTSDHETIQGQSNYILDGHLTSGIEDIHPNAKLKKSYFENYYHEEYFEYISIMDLYYLQDYLELKGAKVFICVTLAGYGAPEISVEDYYEKLISNSNKWYEFFAPEHSFHTELQTPPNIKEVIKKINWLFSISTDESLYLLAKKEGFNLHEAGLVHDDRHLTELGNEILAQGLYSELKKYE